MSDTMSNTVLTLHINVTIYKLYIFIGYLNYYDACILKSVLKKNQMFNKTFILALVFKF